MSSKTGLSRFCHFALLFALIGSGLGCGSGGGGGNDPGKLDPHPPHFGGLTGSSASNITGDVELTAKTAADGETPQEQLVYLIYVSTTFPVDRSVETPYQFTGADACTDKECRFQITDLKDDGTTTYFFASRAKDAAGNLDEDPHPDEEVEGFPVTPTRFTDPGNNSGGGNGGTGTLSPQSLNVDPNKHAVRTPLQDKPASPNLHETVKRGHLGAGERSVDRQR
jgi:hypothetical protein